MRLPFAFAIIALLGSVGATLVAGRVGPRSSRCAGGNLGAAPAGRLTTSEAPQSVSAAVGIPPPSASSQTARQALIVSLILEAEAAPSRKEHEEAVRDLDTTLTNANAGDIVRDLPYVAFNTLSGTRLVERWARQDRAAAAEWLAGCPGTDMAQATVLLYGWLEQDVVGVRRYVERLAPGHWKQEVLKAAVWEAVECGNFAEAIHYAQQLGANDDREGLLMAALKQTALDASPRKF